jgi:translation initiation factor 1 (eIF-1/SUI1)
MIVISRTTRNKKKFITVVTGLEKFGIVMQQYVWDSLTNCPGVKLPDASKLFAKKFSCGCSVIKGAAGDDEINVQGDFTDDLIDFITEKWEVVFLFCGMLTFGQISDDSISLEDKTKKKSTQ